MYERSYIWTINSNMNKWSPKDRVMFVFGGIAYFEFCSIFFKRSNYGMNVRLLNTVKYKHEPVFGRPFIHITVDGPYVRSFIHLVNRMARVQRGESTLEGFDLNAKVATTVRLAQRRLESQRVSTSG